MNGERKIEIIRPFEEAVALTKKILFQPFIFEKWLVIGFAAFLSGHFSGGGGFHFPIGNFPRKNTSQSFVPVDWEQWKPWMAIAIAIFVLLLLAFIVLVSWLRARGSFIFTDCIVRNRGAIAEPWREYRREGNSYFLFLLLVALGSMALFAGICFFGFALFGIFGQGTSGSTMTPIFIVFLGLFFVVWLCFAFFFGLTSYFMAPLMYVRRCRAVDAFRQTAMLLMDNPGPFILLSLFGICLVIGTGIVGLVATCATCCIAGLPYVGTVLLLPVFVCLRAFGLLFIRQFGPDYDVWASLPPTVPPPPTTEPPPLPS